MKSMKKKTRSKSPKKKTETTIAAESTGAKTANAEKARVAAKAKAAAPTPSDASGKTSEASAKITTATTPEEAKDDESAPNGNGKSPRPPAASSAAVRKSMQGNKCKDTKPELLVRQHLRKAGLTGYRLQWKAPGRPDIAWPGKKVCIQVMGCFWHRHEGCKYATSPKSHTEYWVVKFDRNVERDKRNEEALREAGWKVHLIWECQLKKSTIEQTMSELLPVLADELGKELKTDQPA